VSIFFQLGLGGQVLSRFPQNPKRFNIVVNLLKKIDMSVGMRKEYKNVPVVELNQDISMCMGGITN